MPEPKRRQPAAAPPRPAEARRHAAAALLVILVTCGAYANSLHGGFVLDSRPLILDDARVHELSSENLDLILHRSYWWPHGESGLYRPVTTFSYLLNYAVFENAYRPEGYHVVNLLLQVANALLLYALAFRLFANRVAAGLTAALWAVHPLGTEAVTNIVGRADLLAAASVLGALLAYARARETIGRSSAAWFAVMSAAVFLGVFAKESAVVIIGLLVLYEIMRVEPSRRRWVPVVLAWAATSAAIAFMLWQRQVVLGAAPPAEFPFTDNPIVAAGWWRGRLTALAVIGRYIWLAIWPATLSCDYSYAAIPLARGVAVDWLAWLTVGAAVAGAVASWRGSRPAGFGAAFAFVALLPGSNLPFATGTIMADRLMYLPLAGVSICAIAAATAVGRRLGRPAIAIALLSGAIIACAARTIVRNADWRDDLAVWEAAERAYPGDYKPHKAVAGELAKADAAHVDIDRVIAEADRAVAILDGLPDALSEPSTYRDAGGYYLRKGDLERERSGSRDETESSRRAAAMAVPLLRRYVAVAQAAGAKLAAAGSPTVAANTASMAADGYRLLTLALLRSGDAAAAVDAAARGRALDPLDPANYRQNAAALLGSNRPTDAAIMLAAGALATGDASLHQTLVGLFREGLDPDGCAIMKGTADVLDPSCPVVRTVVCAAAPDAIDVARRSGKGDLADAIRSAAAGQFRCDASKLGAAR